MCLMTHLRNFYYHPDTAKINAQKSRLLNSQSAFLSDKKPVYFFIT